MRLTPVGKFVLLILVVGAAIGGWRAWQGSQTSGQPGKGGGFLPKMPKLPHFGGGGGGGVVEVPFVITAAKKGWAAEQIKRFNELHKDKWLIKTEEVPSRQAMHRILAGDLKPVLWSPGGSIWPTRLTEAWAEKHVGSTLIDVSDTNSYRLFLRSPLVFLTTKEKARFLRPLLGGSNAWVALRQLSTGATRPPWGRFKWSFAEPVNSSSGMLTMGLILYDYAQKTGQSGSLEQVAKSSQFLSYLNNLGQSVVYDEAAKGGTTKLTKSFIEDPSRYDVITAYEGTVLDAVATDSNLAVIYPNPTANSEHSVSLLNSDWVSAEQKEAALAFMQFLGQKESIQSGVKYNFRPVQATASLNLNSELSRFSGQGFQQSYSAIDLPPYTALNTAAYRWANEVQK
jgi:Ca-activated chloride channel family protein